MVFEIQNKVALITGGASGLGLLYAKELLREGAKGVTLADIDPEQGAKALKEIEETFGKNKAIFVKTDVTNFQEFENAFLETIKEFKNVDILMNNAGILNDAVWEKEILININGVVHGMLLGMDKYLPKYKQGSEALIVNISSVAGTQGFPFIPVYTGTKHAVLGMSKAWSTPKFYELSKVRIITVCPGVTMTPLITEMNGRNMGSKYEKYLQDNIHTWPTQEPDHMGKEMMNVIKFAPNGTNWVVEGGEPAYEYIVPERFTMKNNPLPRN